MKEQVKMVLEYHNPDVVVEVETEAEICQITKAVQHSSFVHYECECP